jgi:hypothetical protein
MTQDARSDGSHSTELEILLEAARRANWDALQGPMHLRSGRFRPCDGGNTRSEKFDCQRQMPTNSPGGPS